MTRTTLLCLLVFVPVALHEAAAQTAAVDSLGALLQTELPDSVRARILVDYSYELMSSDPAGGREAAFEALELAREGGLDRIRTRAYSNITASHYFLGDPDPGLAYADSAISLAREIGDRGLEAQALNAGDMLNLLKENYAASLETTYLTLEIAREIGDKRREVIALSNLGETYFFLEDYRRSLDYSLQAAAAADSLSRLEGHWLKAGALSNAGRAHLELGDLVQGVTALEEARLIQEDLGGQEFYLTGTLWTLAEARLELGDIDVAGRLLTEAEALAETVGDRFNLGYVRLTRARYLVAVDRSKESVAPAEQALGLFRSIPNLQGIHDALEFLYRRHAEQGEAEPALAYVDELVAAKDSLKGDDQQIAAQRVLAARRELEIGEERARLLDEERLRRNRLYAGLGGLALFLLVGLVYAAKLRRKNQTIHQQKENVELLSQVGREITSSLHVEDILETTYSRVNALMDASVFGIGLVSEGGKTIDFAGTKEKGVTLPDHSDALDDPNRLAAYCFNKQEEVILNDFAADHQRYIVQKVKPVEGETSESIIYLPLTHQGKKLGVLTVQSFKKGSYGDYEVNILRNVATYTALALDNAEAYRQNEKLLLNILPGPIASRLKNGEETIADAFAEVTVLFADLVGFTTFASTTDADQVVFLLNELFSAFDSLTQQLGIEKIKTIGDAYLAVAGLPDNRPDHAEVMAIFALRMQDALAAFNQKNGLDLRLRIGLNTGPVVAGVIGTHKFVYDLWGDAVNVAARMESHGVAGRVQCSQTTFDALEGTYTFEDRGTIEIKGKGSMEAYLLSGPVGGLVAA